MHPFTYIQKINKQKQNENKQFKYETDVFGKLGWADLRSWAVNIERLFPCCPNTTSDRKTNGSSFIKTGSTTHVSNLHFYTFIWPLFDTFETLRCFYLKKQSKVSVRLWVSREHQPTPTEIVAVMHVMKFVTQMKQFFYFFSSLERKVPLWLQ